MNRRTLILAAMAIAMGLIWTGYSRGSTADVKNQYVELEVYGR
jgi:hypothetical protein